MPAGDECTRPERYVLHQQGKRQRAAILKRGLCCVCLHRDPGVEWFGLAVCKHGNGQRTSFECKRDSRMQQFEVDAKAVEAFKHAA